MPVAEHTVPPITDLVFNPEAYLSQAHLAADFIKEKLPNGFTPRGILTLGSGGLGEVAELIEQVCDPIPYTQIPGFRKTTASGHEGLLIAGHLAGIPILGLKGRTHYNEVSGLSNPLIAIKKVVFPIYVARMLGAELYFATNAAGGLNPTFNPGDLMIIKDHLGLFMSNPIQGDHVDFMGAEYFQPQYKQYNSLLRQLLHEVAILESESTHVHEGTYCALPGRTYEAAPESRLLRLSGVDGVGMSTVPEIIQADALGMLTVAYSLITNVIAADGTNKTSQKEVDDALKNPITKERIRKITRGFFRLLAERNLLDQLRLNPS